MSPRVPGRYWVEGNKATIILLVCFSLLLISVPVAAFVLPFARTQSVADARVEASDHLDAVVATVPAQLVRSDDQDSASEEACPGNPEDELVQIQRVVVVDPTFDKAGWLHQLDRQFEDWRFSRRTLDTDGALRVSLVAPDSSFVSVQSAETEGGTELTLISRSPCLKAAD